MFVLKLVGKVLLIPVWILIAIAWIFVKALVSIYSFARGFVVLGLGALMIGTLICYHDWQQVLLLFIISAATFLLLVVGCFLEEMLAVSRILIGKTILFH